MTFDISATNRAVHSPSTRTAQFTANDVRDAQHSLSLVPILERLEQWQKQDKGKLGRPAKLSFEPVLVAMLLLRAEQSPQLVTEIANVFYQRLTPEAREVMGVEHIHDQDTFTKTWKTWYFLTSRCFQRLLDLIDGFPARRQIMNARERAYQYALRDDETTTIKRARLDWFCNALLEMSFLDLPQDVRDGWQGDVSIDQTKVPAVSRLGKRKVKRKSGQRYVNEPNDALVMEIDADWYAHRPEFRETGSDSKKSDFTWGYAASIAMTVPPDPGAKGDKARLYPALAIAMKLSTPVADRLGTETVSLLASIVERGHVPGRVTADGAYFAQLLPDDLLLPVRALGFKPVYKYRVTDLGKNGTIGGAIQVEGKPYCPCMPKGLVDASILHENGDINDDIYKARITQRKKWEARRKGLPAEDGTYSIYCPALGAAPGVECPLRALNPKAAKKARPMAKPPAEHARDRICTQTSVTVHPNEETRYLQEMHFGSEEFDTVYGWDRSAIEMLNNVVKDGSREDLENAKLRQTRGLTAAAVFTALALVSSNRRMARSWVRKNTEREVLNISPRKKHVTPTGLARYKPRLPMLNPDGTVTLPSDAVAA